MAKGDFELALRGLLGEGAPLSAPSIQRLKARWQAEYEEWMKRDLSGLKVVYQWADGIYSYPKAHWAHIRTTNVVESPFATARLRTDAAKGFKRVDNVAAMIWKLLLVAEKNFRVLGSPIMLEEVYAGKRFVDGEMVTVSESERRAA